MKKSVIAIIGAGNMGAALASGLIASDFPAQNIWMTDTSDEKLTSLKTTLNVKTTTQNGEAIQHADVIIFAVKPQMMQQVASDVAKEIQARKPLIMSIAAGIKESSLQKWLGRKQCPIVRVMPNTPALIGCGASGLFANSYVTSEQRNLAESIMRAVSVVVWLEDEKSIDAVTALSGSGPAYFFLVIEALQEVGEALGLSAEISRLLSLQTAYGAARMALESDKPVEELRQQVTSPGGTTEQALLVLEEGKIRELFSKALQAAKKRSEQLSDLG